MVARTGSEGIWLERRLWRLLEVVYSLCFHTALSTRHPRPLVQRYRGVIAERAERSLYFPVTPWAEVPDGTTLLAVSGTGRMRFR